MPATIRKTAIRTYALPNSSSDDEYHQVTLESLQGFGLFVGRNRGGVERGFEDCWAFP